MIAAWFRARQARKRRAAALREEAEHYLQQAAQMQAQSDAIYQAACRRPIGDIAKPRLYCLAFRLEAEARAIRARAGGDHESADEHAADAAWWDERARQYAVQMEAQDA